MIIFDIESLVIIPIIVYFISRNLYITGLVSFFCIRFMNSPDMSLNPKESNIFYSPSAGYIKHITIDDNSIRLSLFLNVFDNHTQYVPIASKLISIEKHNGLFIPAYEEHSVNNERVINTFYNSDFDFRYSVTQITGFLTRRILSLANEDVLLFPGERFGFIVLGSRIDIIVPKNKIQEILVKSNVHISEMTPLFKLNK